jgi:molybdate transport system substrate-binding protein
MLTCLKIGRFIPALALLAVLLVPCVARAGELRLSAAASMTDVIRDIGAAFTMLHPETRLLPNFASSGSLAKQLAAGAPGDLFIAANPEWMKYLVAQGVVPAAAVQPLAHNRLVVVGRSPSKAKTLADLPRLERIALASPSGAPAGRYAQQALTAVGLYRQLLADGKLVMAKDVRQALLYADRGEVDAAIVYATDALLADRAQTLFEVPAELYPRVTYLVGLTADGGDNEEARAFLAFLQTAAAKAIFSRYGFVNAD